MNRSIALCIILFVYLATLASCTLIDENISWAKNLEVSDILRIEAVRMPSLENERYKDFEKTDFKRIVEIINNARGRRIDNPKDIIGGGITFYISLTDGTRHTFTNSGNTYLVIDGVFYKAGYDWLYGWGDDEKLNDKVPAYFEY